MPFQSAANTNLEAQSSEHAESSALHERDTATPQDKREEAPVTPLEKLNFPDIFPVYPFIV
jgi:hypothetical protein